MPDTPHLELDLSRLDRNVARMRAQIERLGVSLRPHVKTVKCVPVIDRVFAGQRGPITVSTLAEAEHFFDAGYRDILYAVGIAPAKLARVAALQARGAQLTLLLDSVAQARALAGGRFAALIEIDSDGHRAGLRPDAPELLEVAESCHAAGALRGVLTHAGGSYQCRSAAELRAMAERERAAVVHAAERLGAADLPCPVVSVGSTPTASFAQRLDGVSEVRAGVYLFMDLVMVGLGVCTLDDIALSARCTVIGHQAAKGWLISDGGWMALSRDRGTAQQAIDQGYGVVCDLEGRPIEDLIVVDANQEHGMIGRRGGGDLDCERFPIGSELRILPNHACAMAGMHGGYQVRVDGRPAFWERVQGW